MISAIICTYNREKYLDQLLKSIEKQSISPKNFEVVIVNNNSTDNTEPLCLAFIERNTHIPVKYVIEKEQGLSHARNRGIAESSGEFVTFLDDDAILTKSFLKVVYDYFVNNADVDCIGGRIFLQYEDKQPGWVSKYMAEMFGYFDMGETIKDFSSRQFPRGSNMSFRKAVFDKVGNFNTSLGRRGEGMLGSEEKELFFRMHRMGFRSVYLPNALVYHYVPNSRLEMTQVIKQVQGIGCSEAIMAKQSGTSGIIGLVVRECFKWAASAILFPVYVFKGAYPKGLFLFRFRYHIFRGIRKAFVKGT